MKSKNTVQLQAYRVILNYFFLSREKEEVELYHGLLHLLQRRSADPFLGAGLHDALQALCAVCGEVTHRHLHTNEQKTHFSTNSTKTTFSNKLKKNYILQQIQQLILQLQRKLHFPMNSTKTKFFNKLNENYIFYQIQ